MDQSQIPPLVWVTFAIAWLAGLSLIICLSLIAGRTAEGTRRDKFSLRMSSEELSRVGKLIYAGKSKLDEAGVSGLVWAARGLWLTMVVMIGSVAFMLSRAG